MQTTLCGDVVSFDTSSFASTPPSPIRTSGVTASDSFLGLGHDPLGFEDTLLSDTGGDNSNHSYEQAAAHFQRVPPVPKARLPETCVVKSEAATDAADDWLDVLGCDLELPPLGPTTSLAPAPPVPSTVFPSNTTIDNKPPANDNATHATTGDPAHTSSSRDNPTTDAMPAANEFEQSLWGLGAPGPDPFQADPLVQDTQVTHAGRGFTAALAPQMTAPMPSGGPGCGHSPRSDTGSSAVSDPASGSAPSDTPLPDQHQLAAGEEQAKTKPTKGMAQCNKQQPKRGMKLESKYDWDEQLLMMPRAEFVRFTRTNKHLTKDQLNDLRQTRRRMKNRLYQKDARDRRFIRVARERELTRHQLQASVRRLSARCVRLEAIIREHCPEQLTVLSGQQA